jgi:hypothetical protein
MRLTIALVVALLACGGSNGSPPDAGPSNFTLTLSNFDSWCAITVVSPAGTTLPHAFASGTVVMLHGEPASASFEWAPSAGHGGWSGAIDSGQDPLSKDTKVTMSADKAVGVCCPFANGTGCP